MNKIHNDGENSPIDFMNTNLLIDPPITSAYYPDPVAVIIDPSLIPPNETINYIGPPSNSPYYPGPEIENSDDQSLKIFLPVIDSR